MIFGSACSGVDAASLAWEQIGWSPAWFAEIEPAPCEVLAAHCPTCGRIAYDIRAMPCNRVGSEGKVLR